MKIILFLALLFLCASAQHSLTCGASSCSTCTCSNNSCPELVRVDTYLHVLSTDASAFMLGFSLEGSAEAPADTVSLLILLHPQYLNLLQNQSYSYLPSSRVSRTGTCGQLFVETKGRGADVIITCENPTRDCYVWFSVYISSVLRQECEPGCAAGSVQDGVCQTGCNVIDCDSDGGDCAPTSPTSAPPVSSQTAGSGAASVSGCQSGCLQNWIGNGYCENVCNNAACEYDGGDCENPCDPDPCYNGGSCRRIRLNDWTCDCPLGFCGETCESREERGDSYVESNSYCDSHHLSCSVAYSTEDYLFCCEYKSTGSNYTCREFASAVSLALQSLLLVLLSL